MARIAISAAVTSTDTPPISSGSTRRGQRREDREQDQRDDREADALGTREVVLGQVDHARPQRAGADQVQLHAAVLALVVEPQVLAQDLHDVRRVVLVDVERQRDHHRLAGVVLGG